MRRKIILFPLLVVGFVLLAAFRWGGDGQDRKLKTSPIVRGPLRMTVETTGSVSPLVSVNVGCEVSGTVGELHADFNSVVKKGQVLARLKPEMFEADLAQARANVLAAQAERRGAEVELHRWERQVERLKTLREKSNAAADEEVRTAQENAAAATAKLAAAEAAIKQADAVRDLAQTKLDRSVIFAPMDGIVLSRLIDVGQTVVAALTTPMLFVLAPDLDRMQVNANVSESDIGRVRVGQSATFTVDAYVDQSFSGRVVQVRNNPTTIQNVVTYVVVIEVDNRARLLKPGMTANVTIEVARRDAAAKVANAALRFRPPVLPEQFAALTAELKWPALSDDPPASSPTPLSDARAPEPPAVLPRTRSVLWQFSDGRWTPVPVVLGITDNRETEVVAGIEPGQTCVVGLQGDAGGFSLKQALNLASPENRRL